MSPAEAAATDPQQRVLLELALLALADTGGAPASPTGALPAHHSNSTFFAKHKAAAAEVAEACLPPQQNLCRLGRSTAR